MRTAASRHRRARALACAAAIVSAEVTRADNGCQAGSKTPEQIQEMQKGEGTYLPFEVRDEGDAPEGHPAPGHWVFSNEDELREGWKDLHTGPKPPLHPLVDSWGATRVLVLFAGEQKNAGTTIQIRKVVDTGELVKVEAEVVPGKGGLLPADRSSPYKLLFVPSPKPIQMVWLGKK